ncbi:MAG: 4Fe-4S dicluster domain-containing protein [Elusimicrobiota bacterium]
MSKQNKAHGSGKMVREVLENAVSKVATELYPFVKIPMPKNFRGKIKFESSKCIGCKLCMRDCPSDAIKIVKVGDKRFQAEFDLAKCIYCAQCVDSCMKDALVNSAEFELASLTRDALKIVYPAKPVSAVPVVNAAVADTAVKQQVVEQQKNDKPSAEQK